MGGHKVNIDYFYNGMSFFQEILLPNNTIINNVNTISMNDTATMGKDLFNINYLNNEFKLNKKLNNLTEIERINFNGLKDYCCVVNNNYYWSKDTYNNFNKNNLDNFSKYRTEKNIYINTCDPDSKQITNSYCNSVYLNNCVFDNKSIYNSNLEPLCTSFFENIQNQYATQKDIVEYINNIMYDKCKSDLDNFKYCKAWIIGIRKYDDININNLADTVLYNQKNQSKYPCIFTPSYILSEASKHDVPYECWYANCSNEPLEHLTTINLRNRKLCYNYSCNISINEMNVSSKTDISLSCINIKKQTHEQILNNLNNEIDNNMFPILHYTFFILLIIIFIIFIGFNYF